MLTNFCRLQTSGFTLIETLVAAFVITMGAGAAFVLLQQTLSLTTHANFQLEASYLAQEGMEIVRNIRDTNLLKIHKGAQGEWTNGLTKCEAGCGVGYQQARLWPGLAGKFLNIRADNGFYGYAAGTPTIYKRKITVTQPSAHALSVLVEVTWEERGRSHRVTAATELYNWLPAPPQSL